MATLEKLILFGLRSFGPFEEDVQQVKFSSPLTLFLGENGCGKTTIIEALKFACSGDVPGGSKSGQGFVHDPKLNSTSTTKGQVRLRFADTKNNKYIVSKSVQLINKGQTSSFKRLDSTLQRVVPDGPPQAISSRCANIDSDICEILGVSKAILNSVIFCHQEDAAWPLDEPKKLKEKFDEIFGATEYNKCIETIRKIVKDRMLKNKDLQATMALRQQTKEAVDKQRVELHGKEEKLESLEKTVEEKEARLQPIRTRLREICDLKDNLGVLQQTCTEKETIIKGIITHQNDILKNITKEFAGSDQELQREISMFEINRSRAEEKRKDLDQKKRSAEKQKERLQADIGKVQVKLGKLQGEKNQHQNQLKERNSLIERTANNLKISLPTDFISAENAVEAIGAVSKFIDSSKASLNNLIREFDAEEVRLQDVINKRRDNLSKTNTSIDTKNEQIQDLKSKTRDINSQLKELDYSDEQLKNLQTKITRIDSDLNSWKASFDVDAITKGIEDGKKKIRQDEETLEGLEREYKTLQQNSIVEAELETLKQDTIKRESEIEKIKNTHFDTFNVIFDDMPEPGFFKRRVENEKQSNSNKIGEINKKIAAKQRDATTLEAKCKFERKNLESLEKELENNTKQVFEVCKGRSFDIVSKELHQSIEKLQRDKGQYSSAKIMYERFLQEFQSQKPCCPVCQTDFVNNQGAVKQIISTIRNKIQGIPQELKELEEKLRFKQQQYTDVLQLKPLSDKIEELQAAMIPNCNSQLTTLDNDYTKLSQELSDLNEQLTKPQSIVDACNKVIGDAALIDQHQLEIHRSQLKIVELESQLVQVPSNRSRQQAEAEIEDLKVDLSNARRNVESSQKKLQQHNDRCQELREERSKHVEKQLQLQKAMQGKPQLQEQLIEFTEKEQSLRSEITELQMQLSPLKIELSNAETDKESAKSKNRAKLNEARAELNRNQETLNDINKLQRSIDVYVARDGDKAYETALQELTDLTEKIDILERSIKETANDIAQVSEELVNQNAAFRTLNDNLILREKRKEVQSLTEEITQLKQQIGSHNFRTVLAEQQRLEEEESAIGREINNFKGRIDELKQDIRKIQADLNIPEKKQIHTNYKKAVIEYTCAKKMSENLQLYMKALERGVLEFHRERMSQINKIIRHLWRSIYKGNDCDYIEIKTEDTDTNSLRRQYNYKVIQMKNDVEIDMRGRCSAGQKVLACLVIRMALAETFSKNCGILALDEPTTNLDRANISSLSEALARIVNTRQSEKNFQLLIITHDEEFLAILKNRVDKVSHFWRVSRNNKGNSVITRELL